MGTVTSPDGSALPVGTAADRARTDIDTDTDTDTDTETDIIRLHS